MTENKSSFSRLTRWEFCPFMDKLYSIDGIKIIKYNEHFAFGSSMHKCIENILLGECKNLNQLKNMFSSEFSKELSKMPKEDIDFLFKKKQFSKDEDKQHLYDHRISLSDMIEKRSNNIKEMSEKGPYLAREAFKSLEKNFPGYAFIAAEFELSAKIKKNWTFEGFMDIIFQLPNGNYVISDWKMSGLGWTDDQKIDEQKQRQLVLYKHFFCELNDIPLEQVQIFFIVCNRSSIKSENGKISITEQPIEFVEVKDDQGILREKSLKVLNDHVYNVEKKNFLKKKNNCWKCLYRHTKYCPNPRV